MPKKKVPQKRSFPILWIALALLLIVGAVIVIPRLGAGNATATLPDEVSVTRAAELHNSGVMMLDVREPDEWNQAHIAGAVLIPLGELQSRLNEVPKDQPVVVYCRTGHRSASGRDILKAAGYTNVTSMTGGITTWISQGLPTVSGP